MKIRRYVARDMRTALAQIKEELGAEAVIMSNKKIAEGVELMAAVDYNQETVTSAQTSNDHDTQLGLAEDSVSIRTPSRPQAETPEAPADSLAALLKRQVQQNGYDKAPATKAFDSQIANSTVTTPSVSSHTPDNNQDIEQQFKDFTARLEQSAPVDAVASKANESNVLDANDEFKRANVKKLAPNTQNSHQSSATQMVTSQEFENMQKEMSSIRQLLEHQMSGLMWQDMAQKDPAKAVLVNRLMAMGLNDQVADQIAGYIPAQTNETDAWEQAKHIISQQLNTTNNDIIQRGGVVSLVGPTGVGKTTTIAKLAARFAQIHGADQVVLISTDSYRIAGFEQLSTYGRIIGCQVKLANDGNELDELLQQFSQKKLVLIDTAGMGQRDMRLTEHLTTLIANARVRIRNYLVLSANTQQRVMQENVERFKRIPLAGCIYTKLDESLSIGEIITTSLQNGLPIGYLTDGQRVPEDIKVANAEKLVTLADKMTLKLHRSAPTSWRMPVAAAV